MSYCTPLFERLPQQKRDGILKTALEEFAALGYQAANINIIARKSSVSVGAIYKYFETKENLFLSVCMLSVDALKEALKTIQNVDGGFFDKIEQLIRIIQKHSRENPDIVHLYNEMTTQGNSELAAKLSFETESITAEYYSGLIRDSMASGELSADLDERMAAFCLDNLFMTLQFSYATGFYRERMKIYIDPDIFGDDERVLASMMSFIRRALKA